MYRVAIVEDDEKYANTIIAHIKKYSAEKSIQIQTDYFGSGEHFIFSYEPRYDILFLDIEMPGMNGMEVARQVRDLDKEIIIIFVTNMAQYAINGYKVQARSYILKPINYYSFSLELQDAISAIKAYTNESILIQQDDSIKKLSIDEIYYVEVERHLIYFHTTSGIYKVRDTMKNVEAKLDYKCFARCNVSFLVNLNFVDGIADGMVQINGERLSISRNKRKSFIEALSTFIGGN
ncbi:MAG: response regulator transcription factor [Pseudobutyrivibrio ruminis]|nr:response regulator transcription factor [Pseudobutyrivibrio ruminis]